MIGVNVDDASSSSSQMNQLLTQLIGLINESSTSIDELTNQHVCELIRILNKTNGSNRDEDSANSNNSTTTSNTTLIIGERIEELMAQLQHLINKPITSADSEYLNQIISQLISEITGGKIGYADSSGKDENNNNTDDDDNDIDERITTSTSMAGKSL